MEKKSAKEKKVQTKAAKKPVLKKIKRASPGPQAAREKRAPAGAGEAVVKEVFGLHNLAAPKGANTPKRILGRGPSSGHGKTSTRGSKGQTSRAGRDMYLGFEGGQTPLIRRIPKRGFNSKFPRKYQLVNLSDLNRLKETNINPEVLEAEGLIKHKEKLVKILGDGEIKNPVNISVHAISKNAAQKITQAGGKVELIHA